MTFEDLPADIQAHAREKIAAGEITRAEIDEAMAIMTKIAQDEVAGRITHQQAVAAVGALALWQTLMASAVEKAGKA